MAGTRRQLQLTVSATFLKTLLLSSSLTFTLVLLGTKVLRAQSVSEVATRTQAEALTQQGHQQLDRGQAYAALNSWQKAAELYREARFPEGVTGSLINQSLAQQELGHQSNACRTLQAALKLDPWICKSPRVGEELPENPGQLLDTALAQQPDQQVVVLGLKNLGDVLRFQGKPDESKAVLSHALSTATRLSMPQTETIRLSLANTERSLYERSQNRYVTIDEPIANATALNDTQVRLGNSLKLYEQVTSATLTDKSAQPVALQAQLNQLKLLLDFNETVRSQDRSVPSLEGLVQENTTKIQPLVEQIQSSDFSQLSAPEAIYARLNFANSLMALAKNPTLQSDHEPLAMAFEYAQAALRQAEETDNERAKSTALGTLGTIYGQNNQPAYAQSQLKAASNLAVQLNAWDLAYQWQEELGRLYEASGQMAQARESYQAAVKSLERVRANLVAVDTNLQFSFKEKVEPVYRKYMRLLLAAPNPDLEQVISTNEQLQIAELENFLLCGELVRVPLADVQRGQVSATAIHVLNLGDRYDVIVRSPDGTLHRHTPDPKQVESNLNNLLLNLQDTQFVSTPEADFLPYAQALYQELIAPIKPFLPASGTLVFLLDSTLQNLPMTLLHDGRDYLVQDYQISISLGSELRPPQALPQGKLKTLVAGLSQSSPSFTDPDAPPDLPALPEVETEIASVQANSRASVELVNRDFTRDRLQAALNRTDLPILHLSTHGQFSSDPEKTFLLAWDQVVNVRELDQLLRSNGPTTGLELLVLSACQTAKGDDRSALGIAGISAQAGARSTVASLWLADANSTASLMGRFYQGLNQGLTKAEALQQAQLSLLNNADTSHPFYWAPFVLVGSWL